MGRRVGMGGWVGGGGVSWSWEAARLPGVLASPEPFFLFLLTSRHVDPLDVRRVVLDVRWRVEASLRPPGRETREYPVAIMLPWCGAPGAWCTVVVGPQMMAPILGRESCRARLARGLLGWVRVCLVENRAWKGRVRADVGLFLTSVRCWRRAAGGSAVRVAAIAWRGRQVGVSYSQPPGRCTPEMGSFTVNYTLNTEWTQPSVQYIVRHVSGGIPGVARGRGVSCVRGSRSASVLDKSGMKSCRGNFLVPCTEFQSRAVETEGWGGGASVPPPPALCRPPT